MSEVAAGTTQTSDGAESPADSEMSSETLELFFDEAKAEAESLFETVKNYRSNATTVLALATGAAAFFGFEDSAKGWWYGAALLFFAVAALLAVRIHQPRGWLQAPVVGLGDLLENGGSVTVDQARYDLGQLHIKYFKTNLQKVGEVAVLFTLLLAATAAVIICAGINATVEQPATPEKPTRVIIEEAE